jgi:hypothetical protein
MRSLSLAALTLFLSCATNPTPDGRVRTQEQAIASGNGAFALVRYDEHLSIEGELIASKSGYLLLLTDKGRLVKIGWDRVAELTLGIFGNHVGGLATWGVAGSVSTISHGYFMFLSLPTWIITTVASATDESHHGVFACPSVVSSGRQVAMVACLSDAGIWSRFPQGLPEGVGVGGLIDSPTPALLERSEGAVSTPDAGGDDGT